jgi:hypothetical protein
MFTSEPGILIVHRRPFGHGIGFTGFSFHAQGAPDASVKRSAGPKRLFFELQAELTCASSRRRKTEVIVNDLSRQIRNPPRLV